MLFKLPLASERTSAKTDLIFVWQHALDSLLSRHLGLNLPLILKFEVRVAHTEAEQAPGRTRLNRPLRLRLPLAQIVTSCPSWQRHRAEYSWSPVQTLPVSPLWCARARIAPSTGPPCPRPGTHPARPESEVGSRAQLPSASERRARTPKRAPGGPDPPAQGEGVRLASPCGAPAAPPLLPRQRSRGCCERSGVAAPLILAAAGRRVQWSSAPACFAAARRQRA